MLPCIHTFVHIQQNFIGLPSIEMASRYTPASELHHSVLINAFSQVSNSSTSALLCRKIAAEHINNTREKNNNTGFNARAQGVEKIEHSAEPLFFQEVVLLDISDIQI